jgi:hemerythrin superfamily protein
MKLVDTIFKGITMATKDKAAAPVPEQDAIAMLMADHKRVKKLFAEFENIKDEASDKQKSGIVTLICQELVIHTTLEEEIFYPAVRAAIDDGDQMDEAVVEHAGAKDLIAQLQAAQPDDDLYDAKVTVLGEQIDHHVTEEEGSMFPKAWGSGVDTAQLGAQMQARKSELLAGGPLQAAPSPMAPTDAKLETEADDGLPGAKTRKVPARPAKKKAAKAVKKSQPKR